ncbi:MAG: hypothetical protein NVSMB25_24510 [Thermoleophilaceae bacterium]
MIVADTSAVLDLLLDPRAAPSAAERILSSGAAVAAPDLLDVEVLSVLRRWERANEISTDRADQALDDLDLLPITRHPARVLRRPAWALRHNLTAYDAQYVALAQVLDATLLTTDARMARAARSAHVATA